MEVKQEYENGEYEKIENASSTYASCECKTEPDWAGYETADDEMREERYYKSESEGEGLHNIPLPDLPEFKMGIKLEPVPEPVKLPDGTTVPNDTSELAFNRRLQNGDGRGHSHRTKSS